MGANDFYDCDYIYPASQSSFGNSNNIFTDPLFANESNGDYHLKVTSLCIDAGDPNNTDPDGTTSDIGAYYVHQETVNGTLSSDTEWDGIYTVTDNATIASGTTVTIEPGSQIQFNSGKKLNVYGTLNAQGTADLPINFTSSGSSDWSRIYFASGSSGNLEYCDIENATVGVYAYNSDPDIENCWIHDNTYGLIGSSSDMVLTNNKIYDNTTGAFFDGGTPKVQYRNSIYNNSGNGIKFYGANGKIGYETGTTQGLNKIYDNGGWGIYASEINQIFMGSTGAESNWIGGYNTVENNTSNEVCSNASVVEANWNYWGGTPSSSYFTLVYSGTIDYSNYLGSDQSTGSTIIGEMAINEEPEYEIAFSVVSTSESSNSNTSIVTEPSENNTESEGQNRWAGYDPENLDFNKLSDLWLHGLAQSLAHQPENAIATYKMLVEKFPDSKEAKKAMIKIHHLSKECDVKETEKYFEGLSEKTDDKEGNKDLARYLEAYTYREMGESKKAVKSFEKYIEEYPDSSRVLGALFNLVNINLEEFQDTLTASTYLTKMKERFPEEEETLIARSNMGEEVDWSVLLSKNDSEPLSFSVDMPTEFALHNNYPNPFNPTTNINFDLPEPTHVSITIYDITGREVTKLVNKNMNAGYQQVVWDAKNRYGQNVASGLYIYQMRTGSGFMKTNKMMLMR